MFTGLFRKVFLILLKVQYTNLSVCTFPLSARKANHILIKTQSIAEFVGNALCFILNISRLL